MNDPIVATVLARYDGISSLIAGLAILAGMTLLPRLMGLNPTFREAQVDNQAVFAAKMAKSNYAANQRWNRKWAGFFLLVIFGGIVPFCITDEPQSVWRIVRDLVVILMFYDFFYYLTHRFIFHVGGAFEGPLLWMHAVHHRQHNPCRNDSSYIHPLEVAIGLGLYVASIFVLSLIMGSFHIVTIVITWLTFTEINLHNHDRWTADRFRSAI